VNASVQPKPTVSAPTVVPAPPSSAQSAVPSTNSTAAPEVPAPKPPPLKLQSIIFGARPSAMINGKPLFIGDRIREFRVTAISEDSATLVGAGQTNILSLSQ
jgi:hypothetical protein